LSIRNRQAEAVMSDYRDANDPNMWNIGYYPAGTKTGWVWLATAISFVVVLAVAFGVGHDADRVASNDRTRSAATPMTPPAAISPAPRNLVPAPAPAPNRP